MSRTMNHHKPRSTLTELCFVADVAEGQARRVVVDNHAIAVFNVSGGYHVTDDTCTHGFSSLADGELDGCIVTCPWHGGSFDVTTGEAVGAPCSVPLVRYPCEVEDGRVRVDLNAPIVFGW